jgi:hypothetical protein
MKYRYTTNKMLEAFIDHVKRRVEFQTCKQKNVKTEIVPINYTTGKTIPMVHFILEDINN